MPAIWGILKQQNDVFFDKSLTGQLESFYQVYKIENYSSLQEGSCFLGYGHQSFTPESVAEVLPLNARDHSLLFTADCILDNRPYLLSHLPHLPKNCPDGRILLEAYLKWGESVTDHILGAFAFALYDQRTSALHLYTDHMGNRSLFYTRREGEFVFSTALEPLAKYTKASPCEKWLTGCLSNISADMMMYEHLTPYEGILQMPAACHLIFRKDHVQLQTYWSAKSIKGRLPHKAPGEYRQLFIDTITECTNSMLRSNAKTGCTLSGGLDSSCIAAVASAALRERGDTLNSYTSIPLDDFVPISNPEEIADERAGVKATCEMHPNIIPHFLSCPGQDAFTELARLVPLIGYPMKSGHNLTWLDAIYNEASENGCRLMLKGQYGNSTFSWGKALSVFYQLLLQGHPVLCSRYMKRFSRSYHVPRKKILEFMWLEWKNKFVPATLDRANMLCNNSLAAKYRIDSYFKRSDRKAGGGEMDSKSQRLAFIFNATGQMQLGMFDTIMSLVHGILIRDPSKDKRIVELCCRLPVECALAGDVERGMIRTYMRGFVPDSICNDYYRRGVQSADYAFRSRKLWKHNAPNVIASLHNPLLSQYVDPVRIADLLKCLNTTAPEDLSFEDLRRANVLYSCSIFLGYHPGKDSIEN